MLLEDICIIRKNNEIHLHVAIEDSFKLATMYIKLHMNGYKVEYGYPKDGKIV
jgi:hypothetical protein